jgi:hypothetical protein
MHIYIPFVTHSLYGGKMKTRYFNCQINSEQETVPLVVSKKQARQFAKACRAFSNACSKKPVVSTSGWTKNYDPTAHDKALLQFKSDIEDIYQTVNHSTFQANPAYNQEEFNSVVEALKNDTRSAHAYKSGMRSSLVGFGMRSLLSALYGFGAGLITYFATVGAPSQAENSLKVGIGVTVIGIISSLIYKIKRRKDLTLKLARDAQIAIQGAISKAREPQEAPKPES